MFRFDYRKSSYVSNGKYCLSGSGKENCSGRLDSFGRYVSQFFLSFAFSGRDPLELTDTMSCRPSKNPLYSLLDSIIILIDPPVLAAGAFLKACKMRNQSPDVYEAEVGDAENVVGKRNWLEVFDVELEEAEGE